MLKPQHAGLNEGEGDSIAEIHKQLLTLLEKFHEICIDNGIRYTLYAGTLLGAVREKGFIPWDDDVDIAMNRTEYERFKNALMKKDYGPEYIFRDDIDHYSRFCRICEGIDPVWIDVLVYDSISDRPICQKLKLAGLLFLSAFSKTKETIRVTQAGSNRSGWRYRLFYLVYLLGKPFAVEWKIRLYYWFGEHAFTGRREWIHLSNGEYIDMRLIHPKEYMEKYELMPFEDAVLMGSSHYHELLTASYGPGYMTPVRYTSGDTENAHDIIRAILFKARKISQGNGSSKTIK